MATLEEIKLRKQPGSRLRMMLDTIGQRAKCLKCGRPIWWFKTWKGGKVPVDFHGGLHGCKLGATPGRQREETSPSPEDMEDLGGGLGKRKR